MKKKPLEKEKIKQGKSMSLNPFEVKEVLSAGSYMPRSQTAKDRNILTGYVNKEMTGNSLIP